MTAEHDHPLPEWVQQERQNDRDWIADNLPDFWSMATTAFGAHGRGALVVNTTTRVGHKGHPVAYFPEAVVNGLEDEDTQRMVREYNAEQEFVVCLLKSDGRTSTYRVRPLPGGLSKLQ
jgi:hypothetical protein